MWHLVICRAHFNISAVLSGAWPWLSSLCSLAFLLSVLALKALTRRTLMAQCSSKHQHFHLTSGPCSSDFVGPHTQASTVLLNQVVSFVFRLPFFFSAGFFAVCIIPCVCGFLRSRFSIRSFRCTRWLSQESALDPSMVCSICLRLSYTSVLTCRIGARLLEVTRFFLLHRRWYTRACLRHKSRSASFMLSTCS